MLTFSVNFTLSLSSQDVVALYNSSHAGFKSALRSGLVTLENRNAHVAYTYMSKMCAKRVQSVLNAQCNAC